MSLYLDASILVALHTEDAMSARADVAVQAAQAPLIVSDFAALELASSIARMARIRVLTRAQAVETLADFDTWSRRATSCEQATPQDVSMASGYIRRLDLNLRGPDAIHLAIAQRVGAALLTFDAKMKACAKKLGLLVA